MSGKHQAKGSPIPTFPNDGKLRLYSMRFCPYAQRAHLVLEAKNIPYHVVYINLHEKPEWLTKKSPLSKVPALELPDEKGDPLIESLVIAEYLDDKYPQRPLRAADPLQRARDRVLIERFQNVLAPLYKILTYQTANLVDIMRDFANALELYEDELRARGTAYFGGGTAPGFLDYMIWPWCERSEVIPLIVGDKYELDKDRFAKLIEWRDLMKTDSAVKSFYVTPENHFRYFQSRRDGEPNYDLLAENHVKRLRTVY